MSEKGKKDYLSNKLQKIIIEEVTEQLYQSKMDEWVNVSLKTDQGDCHFAVSTEFQRLEIHIESEDVKVVLKQAMNEFVTVNWGNTSVFENEEKVVMFREEITELFNIFFTDFYFFLYVCNEFSKDDAYVMDHDAKNGWKSLLKFYEEKKEIYKNRNCD